MSALKLIIVVSLVAFVTGAQLPDFIEPCSRSLPTRELSECVTAQARKAQPRFVKGIPELNIESLDPLSVSDVAGKAGTFTIESTDVQVKGLRKIEIKDTQWDLEKNKGVIKLFGNLTFLSNYRTDGNVLQIPINGNGKLTVKMLNTELLIKFKLRKMLGQDGVEHLETYDLQTNQSYGNVKIHLSNILGGSNIGDIINQVLNENWRELMAEVGPPYVKAVATKVHDIINDLYSKVPYDQLFSA